MTAQGRGQRPSRMSFMLLMYQGSQPEAINSPFMYITTLGTLPVLNLQNIHYQVELVFPDKLLSTKEIKTDIKPSNSE